MSQISDFIGKFNTSISLDQDLIVKKDDKYFLLDPKLKSLIKKDFLYAGIYLGRTKNDAFFPSFNLLTMLAQTDPNRIVVDNKTEWLFICGRDIFKQGITRLSKPGRKGDYTLILTEHGDSLGFGRILHYVDTKDKSKIAVKNIADIGDFLRRER
jgi:ribosome biogenesis protein Nip4